MRIRLLLPTTLVLSTLTVAAASRSDAQDTERQACRFKAAVQSATGATVINEGSYGTSLVSSGSNGKLEQVSCEWKLGDESQISVEVDEVTTDKVDAFPGMMTSAQFSDTRKAVALTVDGRPAIIKLTDGRLEIGVSLPKSTLWVRRPKSGQADVATAQTLAAAIAKIATKKPLTKCTQSTPSVLLYDKKAVSLGPYSETYFGTDSEWTTKGCAWKTAERTLEIGTSAAKDFASWSKTLDDTNEKTFSNVGTPAAPAFVIRASGTESKDQAIVPLGKKAIRVTITPSSSGAADETLALTIARRITGS
jgi:hypothetical protein